MILMFHFYYVLFHTIQERCILSIVVNVPCDQRCQCYSIRVSRPCHFKIARCKKQLIMTTLEYLVVTLTKNQIHTTTALVIKPTHHHRLMVIIRTQHAQFRHPVPEPQPISPLISMAVVWEQVAIKALPNFQALVSHNNLLLCHPRQMEATLRLRKEPSPFQILPAVRLLPWPSKSSHGWKNLVKIPSRKTTAQLQVSFSCLCFSQL